MESSKKRRRSVRNIRRSSTNFQVSPNTLGVEEKVAPEEGSFTGRTYGSVWVEENESTSDSWAKNCLVSSTYHTKNEMQKETSSPVTKEDNLGFLVDIPDVSISWPGVNHSDGEDRHGMQPGSSQFSLRLGEKPESESKESLQTQTWVETDTGMLEKSHSNPCDADGLSPETAIKTGNVDLNSRLDETFVLERGWRPVRTVESLGLLCSIQPIESNVSLSGNAISGKTSDNLSYSHSSSPCGPSHHLDLVSTDSIPLSSADVSGQSSHCLPVPDCGESTSSFFVPAEAGTTCSSQYSHNYSDFSSPELSLRLEASLSDSQVPSDLLVATKTPALNQAICCEYESSNMTPDSSRKTSFEETDFDSVCRITGRDAAYGETKNTFSHFSVNGKEQELSGVSSSSESEHDKALTSSSSTVLGASLTSVIQELSRKLQAMQTMNTCDMTDSTAVAEQNNSAYRSVAHAAINKDVCPESLVCSQQQQQPSSQIAILSATVSKESQACIGLNGNIPENTGSKECESSLRIPVSGKKQECKKNTNLKDHNRLSLKKNRTEDGNKETSCQNPSPLPKLKSNVDFDRDAEMCAESQEVKSVLSVCPTSHVAEESDAHNLLSLPSVSSESTAVKIKKGNGVKKHPSKNGPVSQSAKKKSMVSRVKKTAKAKGHNEDENDYLRNDFELKKGNVEWSKDNGIALEEVECCPIVVEQNQVSESKVRRRSSRMFSPLEMPFIFSSITDKTSCGEETVSSPSVLVESSEVQSDPAAYVCADSASVKIQESKQCSEVKEHHQDAESKARRRSSRMFSSREFFSISSPSNNNTAVAGKSSASSPTADYEVQSDTMRPQTDSAYIADHHATESNFQLQWDENGQNLENIERCVNQLGKDVGITMTVDTSEGDRLPLKGKDSNVMDEVSDNFRSLSILNDLKTNNAKEKGVTKRKKRCKSSHVLQPCTDDKGISLENVEESSDNLSKQRSNVVKSAGGDHVVSAAVSLDANSAFEQVTTLHDSAVSDASEFDNSLGYSGGEWQNELSTSMISLSVEDNTPEEVMEYELFQLTQQVNNVRRSTRVRPSRKSWDLYQAPDTNNRKRVAKKLQPSANTNEEKDGYECEENSEYEFKSSITLSSTENCYADSEEESVGAELENLYKNKNYVLPENRKKWQTINENPKGPRSVFSGKPTDRHILFEDRPSDSKLRQRHSKALKVLRGHPKRRILSSAQFEKTMSKLKELLDSPEN